MKIFTRKIGAMPRRREGPPRRKGLPKLGHVGLGEPGDKTWGLSGPLRRARCCSPR